MTSSYLRRKLSNLKLYSSSPSTCPSEYRDPEKDHIINGTIDEVDGQELHDHQQEDQTYDDGLERSKINEIRALLLLRSPSSYKELDDLTIRRFLRAREFDIEKAYSMIYKYLSWREDFVPNGSISPSRIPNELAQNKTFMQGHDRHGRPIVVGFGARHKQTSSEETRCYTAFVLDKICSRLPTGQEKFVTIMDLKDYGYANYDIRGSIGCLSILQDYYPERMCRLFIVHAPSVFMSLWKALYPFIDHKTRKKIIFVENRKLKETLLSYIDESQLPEIYGGKLQLVPIQEYC